VLKIDKRVVAEIIVVMMTVDYPAIKFFWNRGWIMNQQECKTPVFQGH
jgi:hypothetical protein